MSHSLLLLTAVCLSSEIDRLPFELPASPPATAQAMPAAAKPAGDGRDKPSGEKRGGILVMMREKLHSLLQHDDRTAHVPPSGQPARVQPGDSHSVLQHDDRTAHVLPGVQPGASPGCKACDKTSATRQCNFQCTTPREMVVYPRACYSPYDKTLPTRPCSSCYITPYEKVLASRPSGTLCEKPCEKVLARQPGNSPCTAPCDKILASQPGATPCPKPDDKILFLPSCYSPCTTPCDNVLASQPGPTPPSKPDDKVVSPPSGNSPCTTPCDKVLLSRPGGSPAAKPCDMTLASSPSNAAGTSFCAKYLFPWSRKSRSAKPCDKVVAPLPSYSPATALCRGPSSETVDGSVPFLNKEPTPPAKTIMASATLPASHEVRTSEPMEIAKPYLSRVGQAGEYSHVTGQLFYVHAGGGIWVVRYAPLDREDRYGGSFVLAPLVDMEKYQDGDLVTVHGEVLHEGRASKHLGGSLYKVTSISLVDRLVGVSK